MKYLPMLLLGIVLTAISVPNLRGSTSTIHWYNRRRVSEEDAPAYGRAMGTGTLIMGISVVLTAALQIATGVEALSYLVLGGFAVGLAIMLFAQIKYNKGIF